MPKISVQIIYYFIINTYVFVFKSVLYKRLHRRSIRIVAESRLTKLNALFNIILSIRFMSNMYRNISHRNPCRNCQKNLDNKLSQASIMAKSSSANTLCKESIREQSLGMSSVPRTRTYPACSSGESLLTCVVQRCSHEIHFPFCCTRLGASWQLLP